MRTTTRSALVTVLLLLGISACSGDETPSPVSQPGVAAVEGYPGLYYDASVVSVLASDDDHLKLVGGMTCAAMDAMLSAGQWSVVDRMALPPGSAGAAIAGIVPGLLLERAGTLAFVGLKGDRDLCTATVMKVQRDGIAITGKGFPGPATGWSATTMCVRLDDDTLNVSLYFDTTAKVGGLATITFVTKDGKYTVDGTSSDFNVAVLAHKSSVLETYSKAFGGDDKPADVTMHALEPGDDFGATATVDASAADRPRGSFAITGLLDGESGEQVNLSLPFACSSVQVFKAA